MYLHLENMASYVEADRRRQAERRRLVAEARAGRTVPSRLRRLVRSIRRSDEVPRPPVCQPRPASTGPAPVV